MPRFVILEHDHPHLHWDLMLEAGERLRTWRLASPPATGPRIHALALADHRRDYLDYEGPVSGDRGTVQRWDTGTFDWLEDNETKARLNLAGARIKGIMELRRMNGNDWELEYM